MGHVIEEASSGRSKCRACAVKIDKGVLRFGERQPNPYGDGEMTLWFHLRCAAFKRPEPLLETLAEASDLPPDAQALKAIADSRVAHPRLTRVHGAERASSGRAKCRHCKEAIAKDSWRLKLAYFGDGGRFDPGGFVHAACSRAYFESDDLLDAVRCFSPDLEEADLEQLQRAF